MCHSVASSDDYLEPRGASGLRSKVIKMETHDDDLSKFEADGAALLPIMRRTIWLRSACQSRSYTASMMNSSGANTSNISLGAFQMRN